MFKKFIKISRMNSMGEKRVIESENELISKLRRCRHTWSALSHNLIFSALSYLPRHAQYKLWKHLFLDLAHWIVVLSNCKIRILRIPNTSHWLPMLGESMEFRLSSAHKWQSTICLLFYLSSTAPPSSPARCNHVSAILTLHTNGNYYL